VTCAAQRDFAFSSGVNEGVPHRLRSRSRVLRVAALLALAGALAACSSSGSPSPSTTTQTVVSTRTSTQAPPSFKPEAVASVHPLAPGAKPGRGEREKRCPYVRTGLDQDSGGGVNMADLEGDRIYRTTVLTKYHPVGCRFYFYAPPYEAVADIRPQTFASAKDAYDAMILTARTGKTLITAKNFVPGLVGISFQTRYFGPDKRRDWAFVFAKGKVMVAVYTQRSDTSRNALYIAKAIARKF